MHHYLDSRLVYYTGYYTEYYTTYKQESVCCAGYSDQVTYWNTDRVCYRKLILSCLVIFTVKIVCQWNTINSRSRAIMALPLVSYILHPH